jgi:hypothetical protein
VYKVGHITFFRCTVDVEWPPTWEGRPDRENAPWWTIDELPEGYRIWRLYSRAGYDYGRKQGVYPTLESAMRRAVELDEMEPWYGYED